MANRAYFILSLLACMALLQLDGAAQCAMCRTALENSAEGQAIAKNFRYGILLLLAAPYAIFGTVGLVIFRAYRKKAAERPKDTYIS